MATYLEGKADLSGNEFLSGCEEDRVSFLFALFISFHFTIQCLSVFVCVCTCVCVCGGGGVSRKEDILVTWPCIIHSYCHSSSHAGHMMVTCRSHDGHMQVTECSHAGHMMVT